MKRLEKNGGKNKREKFFVFFLSCFFCWNESVLLSLESAEKKDPHSSKDPQNQSIKHMTARITYKRRYGFRCSRRFFFCSHYSRGEENVGEDASAFRNVFRSRAWGWCVYTCGWGNFKRVFLSLSFLEREEGLCAKFYARRQRRKREGGMGSRALDLCSGAFFARDDDDSRSGMIDGGRSVGVGFDFLFLCVNWAAFLDEQSREVVHQRCANKGRERILAR